MPSTYTVNLGIEKPATGEQSGTWGDTTNVNFDILDQAINGAARVTLTSAGSSGSPNALQITNGATSDGRNKWVEFYSSGDLGGSVYVQLDPNDAEKIVFVRNSLASSRSILLFQGTYNSGRDLEVPAGVDMVVKFDGGGASAATVTDVFTKLRATEITTPTLTATTADINGGTIDNSVIGGSTAAAVTGTAVVANTSLNIAGDGATVTGIKDEDNMASNSATKLATQQSIKAYVDSQVGTVDTWAEVLANGATSGSTNPEVTAGQALKTNTINETSAGSGVTIDSVLLKDDVVNATDVETGSISANDGTAAATIANSTGNFTVTNFISNSVDIGGGAIDGTVIGGASAAAGSFTTIVGTSATIDDITINGSSITDAGNLTFDIGGDLNIDVDGGDINLKDNGAVFGVFSSTNNDLNIRTTATDEDIVFKGSDGGSEITALTLDMSDSGTANFGGAVVLGGSLIKTGDMTLDASGDIILDAAGDDIIFKTGGVEFGSIFYTNSNLYLNSSISNGDMVFRGNDGGSAINALVLDMSAAGAATFNSSVTSTGLTVNASGGRQYINSGHLRLSDGYNIEWGGGTNFLRGNNSNGDMALNATGNLTLDVIGAITLDSDSGGDVIFADNGTAYGKLSKSSNDFIVTSSIQDGDIIFKGDDGGSNITALTLDMSDGGEAYFAKNIHATSAFLTTTNNEPQLTLISTDADASVGPILKLYRNSASPADGDVLGRIQWSGEDDAGNDSTFARLTVTATDVSNGAETAKMVFAPATSDAFPDALTLTGDGAAFNDDLFVGSTITGYDDITGGAGLAIGDGSDTTAGIMIRTGGTGTGRIYFGDNSGNAAGRKAGRIEYSHSAEEMTVFSTGSLKLDSVTGVLDFDDNGTNIGRFENSSSDFKMESRVQDKDIVFVGNDGGVGINALTLDMSDGGTATFNSHIRLGDNKTASFGAGYDIEITSDGTSGTIGAPNGNLTLDVAGDITLNADGGDWLFYDGSVTLGSIQNDGNDNIIFMSNTNNKDIKFLGIDDSNTITALTLDMSNGGRADFNNDIGLNDGRVLRLGNGDDTSIYNDGSHFNIVNTTSNHDMLFKGNDDGANITALTLDMSAAGNATFNAGVVSNVAQGQVSFYSAVAGSYLQMNGSSSKAWAIGSTGDSSAPNTAASAVLGFHHWNGSAWSQPVAMDTDGVKLPSGKGIKFADHSSANILDDYEEGTWTPVVTDGTNNATMYTSAGNGGKYTKIGRAVTFTAQVTVETIGSVGANAYISGLPFTNGSSGANRATAAIGYGSSLNITAGRALTAYVELNQQNILLNQWDATTGTSGVAGSEITNGGTVFMSGTYYTT